MGAIVSHRKEPSNVVHGVVGKKTKAVSAFSKDKISSNNNSTGYQYPTNANSRAQSPEPSIAILSWGQGVVGTSSHEMLPTGVVTSRGIDREVSTSGKLYPTLQQRSHENVKNVKVQQQKPPSQMTSYGGVCEGEGTDGKENEVAILTVKSIGPKKETELKHKEHTIQTASYHTPAPSRSQTPLSQIDSTSDFLRVRSFGPKEDEIRIHTNSPRHVRIEDLDDLIGEQHLEFRSPDTESLKSAVQIRALTPHVQSRNVSHGKGFAPDGIHVKPYVSRDSGISAQSLAIEGQGSLDKMPLDDAATKIQSTFRGYKDRKAIQTQSQAAVKIQSSFRGHVTRQRTKTQHNAATTIQRYVRGHLARKESDQRQISAQFIQRQYRKYLEKRKQLGILSPPAPIPEYLLQDSEDEEEVCANEQEKSGSDLVSTSSHLEGSDMEGDDALSGADPSGRDGEGATNATQEGSSKKRSVNANKPWKEAPVKKAVLDKNVEIGEKTREEFNMYQEDINDLKWRAEQQIEMTLMSGVPLPSVILISSKVPRSDVLQKIVLPDVIKIYYDFASATFDDLIERVKEGLEEYKPGCKAQNLAFVCQGGPGYMYPIMGKVFTPAKVKAKEDVRSFLANLSKCMSKIDQDSNRVHVIGCNVAGNKEGEKLLRKLWKAMQKTAKCVAPLELSKDGKEMLQLYFDYDKYRVWKRKMHSKVSFKV